MSMTARVLMIQGTMSSAGKSLIAAGLCRIYAARGVHVAPFKAQNMSNNAAVCSDGSEIGRSQFTQALACGLEPQARMNPVLVKPEANSQSQVIVMGKPYISQSARDYHQHKEYLWGVVTHALDELREEFELVILEGAGSPAEINLRRGDIVNMAIARYAQAPVLLAGDIDRGGVFAQLLGTLWLLEPEERELVRGLLINKFRGDPELFYDGIQLIEERGGVEVAGVIPYFHHRIPEEDAVAIEAQNSPPGTVGEIDLVVIRLPLISNFDDFDPLGAEENVSVRYIDDPRDLGNPAAVILPGSKSTIADLLWLRKQGLDRAIGSYARQGGVVVGICGGYQMLGEMIVDPDHVESSLDKIEGLDLLPLETVFQGQKSTFQAEASIRSSVDWLAGLAGQVVSGYEIHMGDTTQPEGRSWLNIKERNGRTVDLLDGSVSDDGRIWGCYLHGIFSNATFRHAWLASLGWNSLAPLETISLEQSLDELAGHLEAHVNMEIIDQIIGF
jgi:adenosylcobyric acid synthase